MGIFNRKKISMDMVKMLRPTSKASLKTQCLLIANGDIEKAERLYDFYAKDMPDMPLYDTPEPTWVDNTKDTLNGLFSFLGEHKDGISQAYEIIRSIASSRGVTLPELGVSQAAAVVPPTLPPINE